MYTKLNNYKVNTRKRTFQNQKQNIGSYSEASAGNPLSPPEVTIYPDLTFMVITYLPVCIDTCTHIHLFIHFTVYGHLDYLLFLAVVTSAAKNILVHLLHMCMSFSKIYIWQRDYLAIVCASLQLYQIMESGSPQELYQF